MRAGITFSPTIVFLTDGPPLNHCINHPLQLINHCNQALQSSIAIKYGSQPLQSRIAINHCNQPLQSTIAVNHCNQPLQSSIAIKHCNQPLQSTIAMLPRRNYPISSIAINHCLDKGASSPPLSFSVDKASRIVPIACLPEIILAFIACLLQGKSHPTVGWGCFFFF